MRGYRRGDLGSDLSAGLTTAVLLVPQAMAYAMLAGLPPIYGLYASTVPLLIYALFGTSRQLAVGPVAMVSLLVAAGVSGVVDPASPEYPLAVILLAAMVGALQLVMGLARMGFLTNLLSHPVISGFTAAAALIIGASQLPHLLGLDLPRTHHVHEVLAGVFGNLDQVVPWTALLGAASVGVLLLLARVAPRLPRALLVVGLTTLAVALFGLDQAGVAIVGAVPAGLPAPQAPTFDLDLIAQLAPTALTVALIGYLESISVAQAFARRGHYRIDPNRELVGLGLANFAGSFFGGTPVTGGFSRTAVNAQAGARTPLASIVTALLVVVTLLFLTPLFHYLPRAVLAAVIIVAVAGLVDVKEMRRLWSVKRSDFAMLAVTFVATLALGIEAGIAVGVGVSLLSFVLRATRPHTAVLGLVPGTRAYRNVKHYPDAETIDGVLVVRIDARFFFGNVAFLRDKLRRLERQARTPVRAVVIDASSVNQLDSSADDGLSELAEDYAERGIELYFANLKWPVQEVMERSGFCGRLGRHCFYLELHDAVQAARQHVEDQPMATEAIDDEPKFRQAGPTQQAAVETHSKRKSTELRWEVNHGNQGIL